MLHELFAIAVALLCLWALVAPNLPTGIFGTLGLGVLSASALMSMDAGANPYYVLDAMLIGLALVGVTVLYRTIRHPTAASAPPPPPPEGVDEAHHVHIIGGKR